MKLASYLSALPAVDWGGSARSAFRQLVPYSVKARVSWNRILKPRAQLGVLLDLEAGMQGLGALINQLLQVQVPRVDLRMIARPLPLRSEASIVV